MYLFRNQFSDVNSTSETWFPNKYIEYDIKKKVDKTREKLASDEMAYDIRQYIDSLKHDPSWVGRVKKYINKLLVNREYIDFFIQIYIQWSIDKASNVCHILRKWHCHNSRYILKLKNDSMFFVQQL